MSGNTPILAITDGTIYVSLLGGESGFNMIDPYWNPNIAQFKGGGSYADSPLADGRRLVNSQYDNVIETIAVSVTGADQALAKQSLDKLIKLGRQASDYWTKPYEYNPVWIEVRFPCSDCKSSYSQIVDLRISNLTNPFGQPFTSLFDQPTMEDLTIIIEREPFWKLTQPNVIIGPLTNLIDNPYFNLWNGSIDLPDSWTNIETLWITGKNEIETQAPRWGDYCLKINVSGSTKVGAAKGVTQIFSNIKPNTEYTFVGWVRSDGVSNGVGRILLNYHSQLEVYRSSDAHGWQMFTGKITTKISPNVVSVNLEILATASNTVGNVYFDGLMFLQGDWEYYIENDLIPYLSGSAIYNHTDSGESNINYLDVWNVPGDLSSDILLNVTNVGQVDIDVDPIYSELRVGMRRSNEPKNFVYFNDPPSDVDTESAYNDAIDITNLTTAWTKIYNFSIQNTVNTSNNMGRFRVLARIKDKLSSGDSTLRLRLSYSLGTGGTNQVYLTENYPMVVNDWTLVDLTKYEMVDVDKKLSRNIPIQINYTIEAKRTSGSDGVKLDYILIMPTDGGFITANLTPGLTKQRTLTIDGVSNSIDIISSQIAEEKGFSYGYRYVNQPILRVGGDGNYFYILEQALLTNNSYIVKKRLGESTYTNFSFTRAGNNGNVLLWGSNFYQYNNKIYFALGPRVYEATPTAFPGTTLWTDSTGGSWYPKDFIGYKGNLFLSTTDDTAVYIFKWNGSLKTTVFSGQSLTNSNTQYHFMNLFKGKLVAITNNDFYIYDDTSGNFQLDHQLPYNIISNIKEFNRVYYAVLYNTTNSLPEIWKYDGIEWLKVYTLLNEIYTTGFYNLFIYNNILFVQQWGVLPVYITDDGFSFSEKWPINMYQLEKPTNGYLILRIVTTEQIWIDSTTTTLAEFQTYVGDDTITKIISAQYGIGDWKGALFKSPNREYMDPKFHRYIFSANRDDYTNVIDDRMLIGIGFSPNFLSPIGKK